MNNKKLSYRRETSRQLIDQRRRQRGARGACPRGNFGPPSANSSSVKKNSCF